MRSARSIPFIVRSRGSHAPLKRPPTSTPTVDCMRPTVQVLHCVTLQAPQGRYLQFQSFDAAYLERLRAADFRTEQHFVAYFSALIQIKLRSRLQAREAIEDVRQETFSRFFVALRGGKILQPERLGAFVNSICNNVLLEHYRSGTRNDSLDDGQDRDFPAPGKDPLGTLTSKQAEEKIRQILQKLSERDRQLLRRVFLEEQDKDEICREFGVDREYLRVLLHRAKKSFKSLYLKHMGEDPPALAPA